MFELSEKGLYVDALQLAAGVVPANRDQSTRLAYNRACLLALNGDRSGAIETLEHATSDPLVWYSPGMLQSDPDLRSLDGDGRFVRLVEEGGRRRADAQRTATWRRLTVRPPEGAEPPRGTIVILHGNHSNTDDILPHWEPVCNSGWTLFFVESSQLGFHTFVRAWEEYPTAQRDVNAAIETLSDRDRATLILAGFSRGARTAIQLALDGTVPASAVIAHEPAPLDGFDEWLKSVSPRRVPVVTALGENDPYRGDGEAIAERLGALVQVVRLPGISHEFPAGFPDLVRKWLARPG